MADRAVSLNSHVDHTVPFLPRQQNELIKNLQLSKCRYLADILSKMNRNQSIQGKEPAVFVLVVNWSFQAELVWVKVAATMYLRASG